jgi:hypothetical protein
MARVAEAQPREEEGDLARLPLEGEPETIDQLQ